ncbi:polysaccharide pyruvyl transferase family protein [Methylotuvimicrobium sp. KM2]|uniref:polysaccharide pyruvyl transferase family protein n=1 Tax=Methylotuvimicrobium sp. KM2 TaxID=3133976 RepID=UPI0031017D1F
MLIGNNFNALLETRKIIHNTLDPLVTKGCSGILIDFPNHSNVGDSAIWLGEICYFKKRKCTIKYVCDYRNYKKLTIKRIIKNTDVIFIHGGGNFGDLYPQHQELRQILSIDFPNNRIIQLPQSINFTDFSGSNSSFEVLSRHKDFHLLVRDIKSYEIAKKHNMNLVYLCPDMALMLDINPLKIKTKSTDIVVLSRTDKEKVSAFKPDAPLKNKYQIIDWLGENSPKYEWLYDWAHKRLNWNSKVPLFILTHLAIFAANAMAKERLDRGLNILGQGHVVITDRLHALLLSWLGQAPVYFVDNNYGKLSNFTNTWLHNISNIEQCDDFEEAIDLAIRKINI